MNNQTVIIIYLIFMLIFYTFCFAIVTIYIIYKVKGYQTKKQNNKTSKNL
jgi:cytochrome c oxidase assembly protein Cox11